jgi:recombinational DNA repair ATPase RecF
LADDILGELDAQRRAAFWKSIPEDCQIIATGTEFRPDELVGTWQNFRVDNGQFFAV